MSEKSLVQELQEQEQEQEPDKIEFAPSWLRAVLIGIRSGIFIFIFMLFVGQMFGSYPSIIIGLAVFMFIRAFLEIACRVKSSSVIVTDESVEFPVDHEDEKDTFPIKGTTFEFSRPGFIRWLTRGKTAIVTVRTEARRNNHFEFELELSPKDLSDLESMIAWLSEEKE